MRRIVAVNHESQPERARALPKDWEAWLTPYSIGETYRWISRMAVDMGWDHHTILVQDDVRFTEVPVPGDTPLTVYGQTKDEGHICPRAFSATPEGWKELEGIWQPAPESLCYMFTLVAKDIGTVLDITTHGES
jgi:hypothetical protein